MEKFLLDAFLQALKNGENLRILAFGSSNTERYIAGTHWFDGLDIAIRETYCQDQRRFYHCVNAGIGGNTTRDLLERFDRDAAFYKPRLAIITIGANDANPAKGVSEREYVDNLRALKARFDALGTAVVFQTYYAIVPVLDNPADAERFERFQRGMNIVRDVARETGAGLIDHLSRWEPLREKYPVVHKDLMRDAYHVNETGNKVMALHVARCFNLRLGQLDPIPWAAARAYDALMDELTA